MPDIKITPLGAGQDVGRSCILLTMGGKNIMFDCGMHMGYPDERRFPDFSFITQEGPITSYIDCVIISHFHLDHCGALPYMSEMIGYTGPIYMTHPTKAIAPILLEDMRKLMVEKKGEHHFFTSQMIKDCMKKVTAVTLHQSVMVMHFCISSLCFIFELVLLGFIRVVLVRLRSNRMFFHFNTFQ